MLTLKCTCVHTFRSPKHHTQVRDYSLADGNIEHSNTTKPKFRGIKDPLKSGLLFIIEQSVESWKSNSHNNTNKNLKTENRRKKKQWFRRLPSSWQWAPASSLPSLLLSLASVKITTTDTVHTATVLAAPEVDEDVSLSYSLNYQ